MAVTRSIPMGTVRVTFEFLEANQALAALQGRVAVFETLLLDDAMTGQTRAYLEVALVDTQKAEGRLSVALMGEPEPSYTHFAGMGGEL